MTDVALRQAIAGHTRGGNPPEIPFHELVSLVIGDASYKITDELVKKAVMKLGSEKAVFELIVTAAVSAGLFYWDRGIALLKTAE